MQLTATSLTLNALTLYRINLDHILANLHLLKIKPHF